MQHQLLFLDIDGVLHTRSGPRFSRLPLLSAWLRERSGVDIVVSSSTRQQNGIALLQSALGDLGERVLGGTPVLGRGPLDRSIRFVRQAEICAWLDTCTVVTRTIAVLDDDASLFEPLWPPLVLCRTEQGLTDERLAAIDRRLGT